MAEVEGEVVNAADPSRRDQRCVSGETAAGWTAPCGGGGRSGGEVMTPYGFRRTLVELQASVLLAVSVISHEG